MPPQAYLLPSPGDQQHSAFLQRLGITAPLTLGEGFLHPIAVAIRSGVVLESNVLPEALSGDLVERINSTIEDLFYLSEDRTTEREVDHSLRHYQFWRTKGYKLAEAGVRQPKLNEAFEEWNAQGHAKFTLPKLKRWLKTSELITKCSPPAALRHYCGVDKKFRPLEEDVSKAVFEYDERINLEIHDRRR